MFKTLKQILHKNKINYYEGTHTVISAIDSEVPKVHINGKDVYAINDLKYHWHTRSGDENTVCEVEVVYITKTGKVITEHVSTGINNAQS